jgi:hypothetical protein
MATSDRDAISWRLPAIDAYVQVSPAPLDLSARPPASVKLAMPALQIEDKRIMLPGATKDALKALPEFKYKS